MDIDIATRVNELSEEEEHLYERAGDGRGLGAEDIERLQAIKVELDRCYDLLHQREARRALIQSQADRQTTAKEVQQFLTDFQQDVMQFARLIGADVPSDDDIKPLPADVVNELTQIELKMWPTLGPGWRRRRSSWSRLAPAPTRTVRSTSTRSTPSSSPRWASSPGRSCGLRPTPRGR